MNTKRILFLEDRDLIAWKVPGAFGLRILYTESLVGNGEYPTREAIGMKVGNYFLTGNIASPMYSERRDQEGGTVFDPMRGAAAVHVVKRDRFIDEAESMKAALQETKNWINTELGSIEGFLEEFGEGYRDGIFAERRDTFDKRRRSIQSMIRKINEDIRHVRKVTQKG